MNGCQYCKIDTAGGHEVNCPNYYNTNVKKIAGVNKFLEALNADTIEIRPGPVQVLIGQYVELLSAYALTIDAIEVAGDQLGTEKLTKVSLFIESALKNKINEIVALEESGI